VRFDTTVPYVDKVKSVKKTRGFPNRGERYGAKYENGVAYLLSILYQSKNCGQRIHVLFMILSNEEKRMIMKILKKE
jgi:hypothetical protein